MYSNDKYNHSSRFNQKSENPHPDDEFTYWVWVYRSRGYDYKHIIFELKQRHKMQNIEKETKIG